MAALYTKKQLALSVVSASVAVGRLTSCIETLKFSNQYSNLFVTLPDFRKKGNYVTFDLLDGENVYGYYSHLLNIYNILMTNNSNSNLRTFSQLPSEVLQMFTEIVNKDFDFNY